jgi:hypothetical protein
MLDDRLSLVITHADGSTTRWGPLESDAGRIPQGLQFGTSIPGGFKDLQCSLLRDPSLEHPDLGLFDGVQVLGAGNRVAWEGRMARFPREQTDSGRSVAPDAVGLVAALRDREDFSAIIVDRDPASWTVASRQRRANLLAANYGVLADGATRPDITTGSPCIATEVTGAWTATSLPVSEAWYDAGPGNTLGSLYYAWTKGTNVNNADANWGWNAFLSADDTLASHDITASLRAAGPSTGTLTATTATRRWAGVQLYYGAAAGDDNKPYGIDWTCLAVYGDHGLTKRGTGTATAAPGFYASDIVQWLVEGAGFTVDPELIEPTSHIIRHQAWRDPVTREQAILDANRFDWREWGIYDRGPFYRAADENRLLWEARLSAGAQLQLEGEDAEQTINGVVVSYQGVDGARHTAGPPGSGAETEDAELADSSESNAATAHGLQVWTRLDISDVTFAEGAVKIGAAFLASKRTPQRRGQITLPSGSALHPTLGKVPVWMVRAGDWIRVSDHPADVPRRIIETRYDHDQRRLTCTLDNTLFTIDSLLERIGVALIGRV